MDWFVYDNSLRHERVKQRTDEHLELVGMYSSAYVYFSQHWFRYLVIYCSRYIKPDMKEITGIANIYMFKVNSRNTRKKCDICSKLTIKTPERRHLVRYLNPFLANALI